MRYKLINIKTKEEHLCDKVTIDEFDYYVSDEKINIDDYYLSWKNNYATEPKERYVLYNLVSETNGLNPRKVTATNNPNIDVSQIVNEIEELAHELIQVKYPYPNYNDLGYWKDLFKEGYNKSQETHSFSEENMVEFGYFCVKHYKEKVTPKKPFKELLQLWKEQQPKIVYYD